MLKTITFTIMHFCIAFSVAYVLTGSFTVSGLVAIVEPLCNSVGFYFHDKVWKRIEARKADNDGRGGNGSFRLCGHRHF
ncbi:DUF2061 domain-containing protein [Pseudomonas matsuisoli]|uniref:DUF2061 domain-containing protein n=1 Tax=Pseudomonas matsuisoli TaxID=1515666 RepID=A0A917PJW5_9PSED|nr:DUF2061 domain-containing protein [Pseudomonas matsuisoli]GGJ81556.1 hypothetical protein GCM10009304_04300 [Pseudomonas matsuisoli]